MSELYICQNVEDVPLDMFPGIRYNCPVSNARSYATPTMGRFSQSSSSCPALNQQSHCGPQHRYIRRRADDLHREYLAVKNVRLELTKPAVRQTKWYHVMAVMQLHRIPFWKGMGGAIGPLSRILRVSTVTIIFRYKETPPFTLSSRQHKLLSDDHPLCLLEGSIVIYSPSRCIV